MRIKMSLIAVLTLLFLCGKTPAQQLPQNVAIVLPPGAVQVVASSTGTTAAVTATMSAVVGSTNYICGASWSGSATAGVVNAGSGTGVAGTAGGNVFAILPVLTAPAVGQLYMTFAPCLAATGPNVAIQFVGGAPGVGGNSTVTLWGYLRTP